MASRSAPSPRLMLATFYLLLKSQQVDRFPIPAMWQRLTGCRWPRSTFTPEQVQHSVALASRVAKRLGLLETCLVRSLVTARLLLRQPNVRLNIALDTAVSDTPQGHAWVEIDGRNISDPPGTRVSGTMRTTHRIDLGDDNIDGR